MPLTAGVEVVGLTEPESAHGEALVQTDVAPSSDAKWIHRGDELVKEVKSAIHESRYVRAVQQLKDARKAYEKATAELTAPKLEMVRKLEQLIRKQMIPIAAPSKPSDVIALASSQSTATVQWGEPRDNGSEITNYLVQVMPPSTNGGTFEFGPITSAEIDALSPSTSYEFRVKAKNKIGYGIYSINSPPISTFGTPYLRLGALPSRTPHHWSF